MFSYFWLPNELSSSPSHSLPSSPRSPISIPDLPVRRVPSGFNVDAAALTFCPSGCSSGHRISLSPSSRSEKRFWLRRQTINTIAERSAIPCRRVSRAARSG